MKTRPWFLLLLILTLTVFGSVEAQTQAGFISLDCGLVPTTTTYTEKSTNITYKSDADTPTVDWYDEDIHDRGWTALTDNETTSISTDLPIDISSVYDMPQAVMKTVVIPANGSNTCYMRPPKISVSTIFNPSAVSSSNGKVSFTFTMTGNSTLPPLINAAEIYTVLDVTQLGTDNDEGKHVLINYAIL
ncbi:hypothetical protein Bca52824_081416 [Brassica carinata]|uniref:Malectin-like domain-containing protein n=1 Tax=Brassica carinata TaxID=52824 RepID=A0A8X7TQY6_BRACI|nr:hypothetical protein Bca52824_081416 [Brassica carinata]